MDWLQIALWVLAGLGVVFLFIIAWVLIDCNRDPMPALRLPQFDELDDRREKEMYDLRFQIERDYTDSSRNARRGCGFPVGPTLQGRVKAIEQHLGIEVAVKPGQYIPAELVVNKVKKSKK